MFVKNASALLKLALPLIGGHLTQFAITLTDTAMLGWYDVTVLAGQVLGGTVFFVILHTGSGFAWAVMPMVAAASSRRDWAQVRRVTRMGIWLSALYGIGMLPVFWMSMPILIALGQDPDLSKLATDYLFIIGFSLFPSLCVMVIKSYLAALEETKAVFWITCITALINVLFNYILIFGHWGAPELGIKGAALASVLANTVTMIWLVVYVRHAHPEHGLFRRLWRVDKDALTQVFRIGWPIGISNLSEVGLFMASTVMMGWLGKIPLAAHGIALQITSMVFMIHVGLSQAVTVRAGQSFGKNDWVALRTDAKIGIVSALCVAALTACVFLSIPDILIGAFMNPSEENRQQVLSVGQSLLAAAALFQLVDASQILALSLLRGIQDTKVPMILVAISYWLVGVPVSYVLGFVVGMNGVGVWLGLAAGLALAAALLIRRFWVQVVRAENLNWS